NTTQLLELLVRTGEVAISHRVGRERFFDLAERIYPAVDPLPREEAAHVRAVRRLAALGVAPVSAAAQPLEDVHVGEVGIAVTIEGVPGRWRIDHEALELAADESRFEGRTALLSPFDRLTYGRKKALSLWGFEYTLEMYKPAAKR